MDTSDNTNDIIFLDGVFDSGDGGISGYTVGLLKAEYPHIV
jgi:hypothetical protein